MQELRQNLLQRQSKNIKQNYSKWMKDSRSTVVPSQNLHQSSRYHHYSYIQQNKAFPKKIFKNSFQEVQDVSVSRSSSYQTIKNNEQQWQRLQNFRKSSVNLMIQQMDDQQNLKYQFQKEDQNIIKQPQIQSNEYNQQQMLLQMRINEQLNPVKKYMQKAILKNQKTVSEYQSKKTLNQRIFALKGRTLDFLYIMNFLCNTFYRFSLIFIFAYMIVYNRNYKLVQFVIIMEVVSIFIYIIAMGKLLHTKQNTISIYFQKFFYEKPYTDIHMNRILRKHLTVNKFLHNFIKFFNPRSIFKMNTKISLMRQEIHKRIQLILCVIPFTFIFLFNQKEFYFQDWEFQAFVATVIVVQGTHNVIHYLVVYIST